jgi:hypothetical protein
METREWDEIDCKLPKVRVQLSREPETACDTTHGSRDEVIEITNCYWTTEYNRVYTGQGSAKLLYINHSHKCFLIIKKTKEKQRQLIKCFTCKQKESMCHCKQQVGT